MLVPERLEPHLSVTGGGRDRGREEAAQPQPMTTIPLVIMRGIRKSFGSVEVLHGVDFTLRPGETISPVLIHLYRQILRWLLCDTGNGVIPPCAG